MKRVLSFGFAIALVSAFAACTMDFDQFSATGSTGGAGGTTAGCADGCCTALDCPAPQDPCKRATCLANKCGEEAREDGTATDMQTTGDCKKAVCKGGAVSSENDDGDTLDDGNDCTTDTCDNGSPGTTPAGMGTACTSDGGKVCDGAGKCVGCLGDGDCSAPTPSCDEGTHTCVSGTCSNNMKDGTESDTDCGGDCPPCDPGQDCGKDSDCSSGICAANGKCTAPTCSDGKKNGPETDVDCGGGCPEKCGPSEGCDQDQDCAGGDCTGVNGTCVPNCADGVTNGAETDTDCGGGTCPKCIVGQDCAGMDANCESNFCDANDKCGQKDPNGSPCVVDGQCSSAHCVDMVCCDALCDTTCKACNVAGSVGTCTSVPSGQDPASECAGADVCDGAGACAHPDGTTCAVNADCASGHCVDTVCCDTACMGACQACNLGANMGKCSNIPAGQDPANECAGTLSCNGNGACQKANGMACAAGGECESGNCIDSFCCDTACGATCMACNVAGSAGTCSFVPTGTDPANECPGAKTCDGAGTCVN